jgi:hypothetical protein
MSQRRRSVSVQVSMTIVFTAITGVHAAAAWAADGGTSAADAGNLADAGSDAGATVDDTCGAQRRGQPSGAGANTAVLFGAGCC